MREKYEDDFDAGMGAEAVKKLLQQIDLETLSEQLHAELKDASGQKKARIVKRLEVVDAFRLSGNKPEWMIIDVLPVIPPELRPMVQLDGGRFATSDLNDLYRRVINRNNRLKRLHGAQRARYHRAQRKAHAAGGCGRPDRQRPPRPRRHRRQQPRAQEPVAICSRASRAASVRTCWASASTIPAVPLSCVGPELKIYQCGVPKEMALELFRPFVMKKLVEDGAANNIKSAKKMVDKGAHRRSGTRWTSSSRITPSCSTARRRCTAWASRPSSRCSSRAARSSCTR